jgi:sigma-E factor negative regulatory protein RseC
MRAAARVLDVRDERARLACDEQPSCQACRGGRGCALSWLGTADRSSLEVSSVSLDGSPLIAGQAVTIEVPDSELLRSAAKVYLLPLAGLLAGPALVRWTGAGSEAEALLAAVTGVVLGWALARRWVRRSPPSLTVRHVRSTHGH